jgi:hypothetical protein
MLTSRNPWKNVGEMMLNLLKREKTPEENIQARLKVMQAHQRKEDHQKGNPKFKISSASAGNGTLQYVAAVVYQTERPHHGQMGAFFPDRKLVKWSNNSTSPCGGYLAGKDKAENVSFISDWPTSRQQPKWLNFETYAPVIWVEDWSTDATPHRWLVIIDECFPSDYDQVVGIPVL